MVGFFILNQFILSFRIGTFQIGDKVELVEGFDRYGDASSGPLQLGDRGIVVDVQKGANGEMYVGAMFSERHDHSFLNLFRF